MFQNQNSRDRIWVLRIGEYGLHGTKRGDRERGKWAVPHPTASFIKYIILGLHVSFHVQGYWPPEWWHKPVLRNYPGMSGDHLGLAEGALG